MKMVKKSQVVLSVAAIMLIAAGYLNYTGKNASIETGGLLDAEQMAGIGDATFVSSSAIEPEKETVKEEQKEKEKEENKGEKQIAKIETKQNKEDEYFTKSRLERDKMYAETLESYQKIVENDKISIEQKNISQEEIQKLNKEKNAIMISENLIKTKGFEDVIIFVNIDSVSVIVKADGLPQEKISQIQNIISRELKTNVENIHISMK